MVVISICKRPIVGEVIEIGGCRNSKNVPLVSLKTINGGYACVPGNSVGIFENLYDMNRRRKVRKRICKIRKYRFIRKGEK